MELIQKLKERIIEWMMPTFDPELDKDKPFVIIDYDPKELHIERPADKVSP